METKRKKRFDRKFLYWLFADFLVMVTLTILLLHKPFGFQPYEVSKSSRREVSPYLTHKLMPQIYNGAQYQEPFKVIVSEYGINDVLKKVDLPENADGVVLSSPKAIFQTNRIVLMAVVSLKHLEFVATAVIEPWVDKKGLLHLPITSVKLGAVNIGFIARMVAKKTFSQQVGENAGSEDVRTQIATALFDGQPFEPVFKIEDKKIKMKKIAVKDKKIIINFVPYFD